MLAEDKAENSLHEHKLKRLLAKSQRVCTAREFRKIMQQGLTFKGNALLITWIPRKGETRLGITVTRKYAGAVERNRFKRIVREAFRFMVSSGLVRSLPVQVDCNIRPRKNEITFSECVQDFQAFFALFAK